MKVSGMPKCSVSIVIKDNSKSAPFFDSINIINNLIIFLTVIFEFNF